MTLPDVGRRDVCPAPTANAMRRVLARAADGKALDVDEATVLLAARGDDLRRLCATAA
ncbi:MAG: fbiC, partial [Frankiales bacterium]|nr:fbiC [Frankiales bacterium]